MDLRQNNFAEEEEHLADASFHKMAAVSASFDEANLVSSAGLLPVMTLARDAGLEELADERLTVPTDKGANAGLKVASLTARGARRLILVDPYRQVWSTTEALYCHGVRDRNSYGTQLE